MSNNKVLDWIVDHLENNNIPYLICGGLAANAYGSPRPLLDIDLFVPDSKYQDVVKFGQHYISYGPERFQDEHWNVDFVQFDVEGQKIKVGNSLNVAIFDANKNIWSKLALDFDLYTKKVVLGREVRLMTKSDLIQYKSQLGRDVDIIDIDYISEI